MSTLSERLRGGANLPRKPAGLSREDLYEAADELDRLTARVAELEAEHKVNGLIRAWCDLHNRPIPWAKAVEIVAVIHKMPDAEKARLLSLDDPGRTEA